MPPCATTEIITARFQNNNQNFQKIELYGSLTTKDLQKPHSPRWIGGAETWRQVERHRDIVWYGEAVEWEAPQSRVVDKNREGYLGSKRSEPQAGSHSPGFQHQKDKSP